MFCDWGEYAKLMSVSINEFSSNKKVAVSESMIFFSKTLISSPNPLLYIILSVVYDALYRAEVMKLIVVSPLNVHRLMLYV